MLQPEDRTDYFRYTSDEVSAGLVFKPLVRRAGLGGEPERLFHG